MKWKENIRKTFQALKANYNLLYANAIFNNSRWFDSLIVKKHTHWKMH